MNDLTKRSNHELADLHCYIVPISPKDLKATLTVVEHAMQKLSRDYPGYRKGGIIDTYLERIRLLQEECNRMRPVNSDGTHGERHTSVCGCDR